MFTNGTNISLPMAVMLAADGYNHNEDVISVTQLIKPLRELILTDRISKLNVPTSDPDIISMYKSRVGTAIHAYAETVWLNEDLRNKGLDALGIPKKTRDKIVVNPEKVKKGELAVYVEKTGYREILGYEIRGTADVIFFGRLGDYKKTSPLSYRDSAKNHKYALQGSIYRWIMHDLIIEDNMSIFEMYDEWTAFKTNDPNYPPAQVVEKNIPLLSLRDTEKYIKDKINSLNKYFDAPDDEIPECTDADLWRRKPVFKYYKDPTKKARSTGNFDTYEEAYARKSADGNVGVIDEVKSKAVACRYCPAFPICQQAKRLEQSGQL